MENNIGEKDLKSLFKYIFGVVFLALLFCSSSSYGQDISFESFQGQALPNPNISDACPSSSYSFSAILKNNTAATLTNTIAEIRITVSGANNAVYTLDAPAGNIAAGDSFAVTQTINMINSGANSFAVEVYLDASPSTIIDSGFANITVSPNDVSNNLLTPSFTQVVRQQILDIELGTIGAQTGASTSTYVITLGTVAFTTIVASGTVSEVTEVADAIAVDISNNAAYSAVFSL